MSMTPRLSPAQPMKLTVEQGSMRSRNGSDQAQHSNRCLNLSQCKAKVQA